MSDRPDWSAPDEEHRSGSHDSSDQSHGATPPPVPPVPPGWSPEQPPASTPASAPAPGQGWGTPPGAGWGTPPGAGTPPPAGGGWGPTSPGAPAGGTGWGTPSWGPPGRTDARGSYGRPGVIPLRPIGVGEILDGAVTAIRFNPRAMLGLSAAVAVVTQVIQLLAVTWFLGDLVDVSTAAQSGTLTVDEATGLLGRTLAAASAAGLISFVAVLLLTGLLTLVVSRAVLGERMTAAQAWQALRPSLGRLFGLVVVLALASVAFLAIVTLIGVALRDAGVLVFLVGIGAFVWAAVRLCLAPTALVLERASIGDAIRRSWAIVRGAWWRTFGILLLAAIITAIVGRILQIPFALVGGGDPLSGGATGLGAWQLVMTALGGIVASTITWPFTAGVAVLLYVDRRMRREGLDLELARAAGLVSTGESGGGMGGVPRA